MHPIEKQFFGGSFEGLDSRFIDTLPVAVYVCDRNGHLIRFNPRAVEIWGREPEPGDRFSGAVRLRRRDGTPLPHHDGPVAQVLRTGEPLEDEEYVIERADGSRVLVRSTIVPLRDANGQIAGAINTFQDVTLQRRAAADRARLAAIIDSSDDAIVGKTLEGVITSWNAGAERIFGYSAAEAVGQHISFIIPSDRRSEEDDVLARLRAGRKIDHFETVRQRKDGRLIDVSLTVSPIRDGDGQVIGASKVARDVTEQKRAALAIAEGRQRYQRIFEGAGVSIWEQDFTDVGKALEDLRAAGVSDFAEYFAAHPEDVERIRALVRIVDVNATTLEMFRAADKSELLNSRGIITRPDGSGPFAAAITALAAGEPRFHAETELRTLKGERLDVMVNFRFPEPGESLERVLVTLTDITARRRAEEALRQEIQVREALARVGASLTAELDPDRVVQAVTDAATTLTTAEFGAFFNNAVDAGGDAYELYTLSGAPKSAFERFPKPRATELFGPTFRGEGIVRIDDVLTDSRYGKNAPHSGMPAGHLPVRSYLAVPVISRGGEVLGGLFFGHSRPGVFQAKHEQLATGIASWAALALDNARLYQHAQAVNRTKDEFLATLSHELRTPLNAVLGWSHLLRSNALPPDMQRRAFDAMERNAKAQAQLVDDLLDVSRIVSGRLQMKSGEVDLASVVLGAIETVRPAMAAKAIEPDVFEPQDPQVIVMGDADRLRQIFWNLLSNAVKFTPRGGKVQVEMIRQGYIAEILVRDTGQGISHEFLPHVFERFRQADSTVSRRHGGLGLGLAIVRHLTEAHGGTVAAESAGEDRGATFVVRLPVYALRERPQPSAPKDAPPLTLAGLRLLVVDDEPDARELMRALLESHGAEVATASSAGEALDLFVRRRFDVLLADLGMPEQDGYALIQAVRALPADDGRDTAAIAVTAYAGVRERARALAAGFGWHLTKPVDSDQLIAVVTTAARSAGPTPPQAVFDRR